MKVVILAGGSGTRLWPLSRNRYPKQFIKIDKEKPSLFQETFNRSLLLADLDDIYVVTNDIYKFLVMGEVEELGYKYNEDNVLLEPEAKNTLPAIYAGVHEIVKTSNDSIVVFPSDHVIAKSEEFIDIIKKSDDLTNNSIITFGIQPDGPNTGFGYISPGDNILNGYHVKEFKEKPNYELAVTYVENGYFWNSGIFMFNSEVFTNEVKAYAKDIYTAFETSNNMIEAFSKITDKISIDYGIMEKSNKVVVVPADIGWNDLGSFDAFEEVFDKDEHNNIVNEESIIIDSNNNYIYSDNDKLVTTVGVDDLIVVDNRDALLICKKHQSQRVKEVVDVLKERNDSRAKYHVNDYRPWGSYKVLEEEKGLFKIKRIVVNQGKNLDYLLHYHRSVHWIVVRGMAKVIIEGNEKLVPAGESIFIKSGQKHGLENPGKLPLEIMEVQIGDYLEDDDMITFSVED